MKAQALIVTLVLLGASQTSPAEEVKVGVWLPITGCISDRGLAVWNGIKIAKEMEKSMKGLSITLVMVDSRSDEFEALSALLRLIERNEVGVVIGGLITGNTVAGSFCTRRRGIALVTPTVTHAKTVGGKNLLISVHDDRSNRGLMAARFAVERLDARTAAILCDVSDSMSVKAAEAFREELRDLGGSIVTEGHIKRGDRDFSGLVGRIWKTRPDVLYAPVSHVECALMARQAREMGLRIPLVADDSIRDPVFIALGGVAVEGVYCVAPNQEHEILTKQGVEFRQRYEKAFGTTPRADATRGAEAYFLVLDAIRRVGSADPVKIGEALSSAPRLPRLTATKGSESDNFNRPHIEVLQVRGGKFSHVDDDLWRVYGFKEIDGMARRLRVGR